MSNRDLVKNRYVIKLEENLVKEDVQVTLESEKLPCNAQTLLPMGWALKPERKSKHFSEKQKKFLVAKFDVGLKTGRKEDPCLVAKEMRFASEGGKKLFSLDEFLTPQQINSFFSRHAKKVRTETSEATREKTISNIENTLIEQEK